MPKNTNPHYVLPNREIHCIFALIRENAVFPALEAKMYDISLFCALPCADLRCPHTTADCGKKNSGVELQIALLLEDSIVLALLLVILPVLALHRRLVRIVEIA